MASIPWTKAEDEVLKKCLNVGCSYQEIAEILEARTVEACRARARTMNIARKFPEPGIDQSRLEELLALREPI